MARDFDGVDDNISFGSDASIDNFPTATNGATCAMWLRADTPDIAFQVLVDKTPTGITGWRPMNWETFNEPDRLQCSAGWTGGADLTNWYAENAPGAVWKHVVAQYNANATTNDPLIFINGTSQTITEITPAPSGTWEPDAGANLILGWDNSSSAGNSYDGGAAAFCYDNTQWTAAAINRARWWGRPHGGLQVYHPLWTTKVANEGSATANGTVTGATMISSPIPVVRPGTAMMGMEIGW